MDKLHGQKQIAAAIKALERQQLMMAFDAFRPESRPNKKQEEVLRDLGKIQYRYVVAGNQCLPEGTLIPTPTGLVEVQDIRPGDEVYDQDGKIIKVEANFDNGEAEVVELTNRGIVWGESTLNHTWLTCTSSDRIYTEREITAEEFKRDTQVIRTEIAPPLGSVNEEHAYIIGALLGDGCGTVPGLDIIKTWNRESLLKYLAGLIDTDGSVFVDSWDNLNVKIGMQALPVIESVKYAMLALWQTPVSITVEKRKKYVNGPIYNIGISSNAFSKRILKELSCYLQVERKQYKSSYDNLESKRSHSGRVGLKLGKTRKARVFDIRVASKRSLYLTATGLVTHNSGKSQLASREVAWILNDTHPYWERPREWRDEPLLILVAGQDLTMIATELWHKKLAPFLDQSEWRPEKQGNTLKKVINKRTGDQIVFLSHSDGSEKNRKHMQGYTAHYVWLDEMPTNTSILEELQLRVQSKKGYLLATFTPKFRNDKIRKIVDGSKEPYAKKYKMSKFDNPIFAHAFEAEMARLAGFSEQERNTILYGEWSTGDNAVYTFDYDKMTVDKLPDHYNAGWRHVESVDPALRSKCGYTLWAEDPNTGTWYLVNDEYVKGDATLDPETLFAIIQKRSSGYNICRRISDSMAYYTSIAAKHGINYIIPYSKNNRKEELIKGLQLALSLGKVKIGRWCGSFIDEIQSCHFQESTDKIINSSSYHTLDCAQYFCDNVPKYDPAKAALPWQVMLQQSHQKRLAMESEAQKLNQQISQGRGKRVVKPIQAWGRRGKFRVR